MNLLEARNITRRYSETTGIFDFNLNLAAGDRLLLLGPNGAGKTTAMSGILGLIQLDSGQVKGHLQDFGAMISRPVFYDGLSGLENLKVLAKFYKKTLNLSDLMCEVGLEKAQALEVGKYSTGMRQRLDLARALMHEPQVLFLDEPFSGLDIEGKWQVRALLESIQKERAMAIVLSSHQVGELETFANRVMLIKEGRLVVEENMALISASGRNLESFYLDNMRGGVA